MNKETPQSSAKQKSQSDKKIADIVEDIVFAFKEYKQSMNKKDIIKIYT